VTLRNVLSNNLNIKIAAVIIAVALYAFAKGEQTADRHFSIPLVFRNIPEGLTPVEQVPETIDVVLTGANKDLVRLGLLDDPYATVDMSEAAADRVLRVGLSAANVILPHDAGVLVAEVYDPKSLDIEIDRLYQRKLPVEPPVVGTLSDGFYPLGKIKATPDSVTVYGPARVVRGMRSVKTLPLSIEERRSRIEAARKVDFGGPWNLHSVPREVRVTVEVEGTEIVTIDDVPVTLSREPGFATATIAPTTIDVQLAGAATRAKALTADDVRVTVNARGLPSGDHGVVPDVEVPEGIEVLGTTPMSVNVHLE
jgi:YbbR domain-containing protein